MKDSWIPIDRMQIPTGRKNLRVLVYSPALAGSGTYRICDAGTAAQLRDATHWQPALPPTDMNEADK